MTYWMPPPKPVKRKVFISYHHRGDQAWFDYFTTLFGDRYEVFYDRSLDGGIRSDDAEYVNRTIREDYIVGSSTTIVLCGAETGKRKYVDWEIHSTLHHQHALLGIALPTAMRDDQGRILIPSRLYANIQTGYAHWMSWSDNPQVLQGGMEAAIQRSAKTWLADNTLPKMARNLP
jgi:hypothetical protein